MNMTAAQMAALIAAFRTLQPELREWLTSDEAMAATAAIAERLVLSRDQEMRLPTLILRLATGDLAPESFKAEAAQALGVGSDIAEQATKGIAETILAPIAQALRFAGVDIESMGFDAPAAQAVPRERFPMPRPAALPETQAQAPAKTDAPETPAKAKPFMLHEEPQAARPDAIKPSFSFVPDDRAHFGESAPPAKVTIERIVHYANLRSSMTEPSRAKAPAPEGDTIRKPSSKWFA